MDSFGARLGAAFFAKEVTAVAQDLLNRVLVVQSGSSRVALRLTEVEAYGGIGNDSGSHAFRARTPRNEPMFLPGGHLYVYRSYGVHWCVNVVTGNANEAFAVLLRAGEVVDGSPAAVQRRSATAATLTARDLARGPGRLTCALGIDQTFDAEALVSSTRIGIWTGADTATNPDRIGISPRTGVAGVGGARPWRFYLLGEPTVSPYRPAASPKSRRAETIAQHR